MTSLSFTLVGAGRLAQRRVDAGLAAHGLTMRHVGALGHLSRSPDLSYSDLARRAGVTVPSMHATVRRLVDLGAIRPTSPGPGLPSRLEVTDEGRDLLTAAAQVADDVDAQLIADLGAEDQAALREALARLAMILVSGN